MLRITSAAASSPRESSRMAAFWGPESGGIAAIPAGVWPCRPRGTVRGLAGPVLGPRVLRLSCGCHVIPIGIKLPAVFKHRAAGVHHVAERRARIGDGPQV